MDYKCDVVLLGKTNVGKSELFNAIRIGPEAIVSSQEHVTRDALRAPIRGGKFEIFISDKRAKKTSEWIKKAGDGNDGGEEEQKDNLDEDTKTNEDIDVPKLIKSISLEIVDLAGFDGPLPVPGSKAQYGKDRLGQTDFFENLHNYTRQIIEEGDILLMVFDAKNVEKVDRQMVDWVRSHHSKKPVLMIFNKIDSEKDIHFINEAKSLKLSNPLIVSAKTKRGLKTLVEHLVAHAKEIARNHFIRELNEQKDKIERGSEDFVDGRQVERDNSTKFLDSKKIQGLSDKIGLNEGNISVDKADKKKKEEVPAPKKKQQSSIPFSSVLLGKPNAGKSSLFNALLKKERVLVSEMAGTTRDAIIETMPLKEISLNICDTAGLRHRKKVEEPVEKSSVKRAIAALRRSSLSLLLIDATEDISEQDKKIAMVALKEKKGMILVFNKWDLSRQSWKKYLDRQFFLFPHLMNFQFLALSTKTGYHLSLLRKKMYEFYTLMRRETSTSALNKILSEAIKRTPPPSVVYMQRKQKNSNNKNNKKGFFSKSMQFKIFYVVLVSQLPFRLKIFCRNKKALNVSYMKYLENFFRLKLNLKGVPIDLQFVEEERK